MFRGIFDIEVRIDYVKEFHKMVNSFHHIDNTTYCRGCYYSLISAINQVGFKKWPYRGTALTCEEYLENIGIASYYFKSNIHIEKNLFLLYIQFIYNIVSFCAANNYISTSDEEILALISNLGLIAEKMNYQFVEVDDKYLLIKRDASVDSVLEVVDEDISKLLLEYNDFNVSNNIIRKSEILKSLDKFIEKEQSEYSKIDKDSYSSWGYILNNFGINHKINDKYKSMTEKDLLIWYDKAFLLAIHMIRLKKIKTINQERKDLEK